MVNARSRSARKRGIRRITLGANFELKAQYRFFERLSKWRFPRALYLRFLDRKNACFDGGRARASLVHARRGGINTSRPVSRVLSGELPLRDGHSSGTPIAERLEQSTRVAGLKTDLAPRFRAHPATPI